MVVPEEFLNRLVQLAIYTRGLDFPPLLHKESGEFWTISLDDIGNLKVSFGGETCRKKLPNLTASMRDATSMFETKMLGDEKGKYEILPIPVPLNLQSFRVWAEKDEILGSELLEDERGYTVHASLFSNEDIGVREPLCAWYSRTHRSVQIRSLRENYPGIFFLDCECYRKLTSMLRGSRMLVFGYYDEKLRQVEIFDGIHGEKDTDPWITRLDYLKSLFLNENNNNEESISAVILDSGTFARNSEELEAHMDCFQLAGFDPSQIQVRFCSKPFSHFSSDSGSSGNGSSSSNSEVQMDMNK
jgi:hypothetical protein